MTHTRLHSGTYSRSHCANVSQTKHIIPAKHSNGRKEGKTVGHSRKWNNNNNNTCEFEQQATKQVSQCMDLIRPTL